MAVVSGIFRRTLQQRVCMLGMLAAVCQAPLPATAGAVHKCTIDGKVAYQDTPCPADIETVAQGVQRKSREKELEEKLDRLQAKGIGKVERQPAQPKETEGENFVMTPGSGESRAITAAAIREQHEARTERTNAKSAATLTRLLDETNDACGGKLIDYPVVGMKDELFRKCTIHARFGGVTQIVVAEDGATPLRLYVFPTERASRVYAINGVITNVKP
ncbi:MAG: hypothetical protein JWR21_2155 [Herminiimonas sp.]|nr:hypothetical protein [Herminiimonas sp.]